MFVSGCKWQSEIKDGPFPFSAALESPGSVNKNPDGKKN